MPTLQYIDLLLTMFNILLIFAGILEYILLGIDFKVRFLSLTVDTIFTLHDLRIISPIPTLVEF